MSEEAQTPPPQPKPFRLSVRGLKRVADLDIPKDMTFVVGTDDKVKEYKCNSFLANFISHKVAEIHTTDPAYDKFYINISDEDSCFQKIMDLMEGQTISPDEYQISLLKGFGVELGNEEIFNQYFSQKKSELKVPNVIERLKRKSRNGMEIDAEINFIAAHFMELDMTSFQDLPINIMQRILASSELVIDGEDYLFDLLCNLKDIIGDSALTLFSQLTYQNLSEQSMKKFIEMIKPEDINSKLLAALKRRLGTNTSPGALDSSRYCKMYVACPYKGEPFKGIIYLLYERKKENPAKNGLIELRAEGEANSNKAVGLFGQDPKYNWGLNERSGNYLLVDFKDNHVRINGYSIRGSSNAHWDTAQSWVMEGSLDGETWKAFFTANMNTDMGGNERFYTWKCPLTEEFRFIRWRLTQNGSGGLYCRQFEFFGEYVQYLVKDPKKDLPEESEEEEELDEVIGIYGK